MAARRAFLIRLDPAVLAAVEAWAADDLRSANGQIEFLLREALRKAGRKVNGRADAEAAPSADQADTPAATPTRARRGSGTG